MRIQQLIASIRHYALSSKTHLQNPLPAIRHFRGKMLDYLQEVPLFEKEMRPVLIFVVLAFSLLSMLLVESSQPHPYPRTVKQAGFFEKTEPLETTSFFDLPPDQFEVPTENRALAREALLWLSVLGSYDDFSLTNEQLMTKFKNMNIAASILSMTADGRLRRQFWSERALTYGRYSLGVLEGMIPNPDEGEAEEVRTRLLIAMALNYYEDGKVQEAEIVDQFEKISKTFLIRTGFCNNKILKSLHDDQIIQLPNYLSQKYM
ncbi:MAG: hypothetical protein R2788_24225 [Saprospiraceae bacterium]